MPQQTAYKTDENGNMVPFTYIAPAPPNPMQEQQKLIDQAYRDLPLQQAEEAAKAAMVYQGQRGYMRDLANGLSAPEALSKWAPLMFARTPGQGASMVRANPTPKPNYQFVPGAGGAPNRFEAPGERPVFVPRTSMPQEVADQGLIKEEIAPNIFAVRVKGSSTVHIVNAKGEELTPAQKENYDLRKQSALINAAGKLADLDEKSLGYNTVTNAMAKLSQPQGVPAPTSTPQTMTETVKRFTFDPKTRKLIAK